MATDGGRAGASPQPSMTPAEKEMERKRKLNAAKLAGIRIQLKSAPPQQPVDRQRRQSQAQPQARQEQKRRRPSEPEAASSKSSKPSSSGDGRSRQPAASAEKRRRPTERSEVADGRPLNVAPVFRESDSDGEPGLDEMPPECRMRMRNVGRDTPTSSGPNSFGKTKKGFTDPRPYNYHQLDA